VPEIGLAFVSIFGQQDPRQMAPCSKVFESFGNDGWMIHHGQSWWQKMATPLDG